MKKSLREIRNENLKRIIREKFAGSQPTFSKVTGISMSQIGQWTTPEGSPNARNMSEGSARKIESKCSLQSGWMDIDHNEKHHGSKSQSSNWPFDNLSFEKIISLTHDERIQLETAVLLSAAQLGLDVKVDGSSELQITANAAKALGSR